MRARLIGLHGYSGSGKTELAGAFRRQGWREVDTGQLIAQLVMKGEGLDSITHLSPEHYHKMKASVAGFHQKLVTYGQAVRDLFGSDAWVTLMGSKIEQLRAEGTPVIWSNVRTHDDIDLLYELGGKFVRVEREGALPFSDLDTELNAVSPDAVVHNNVAIVDYIGGDRELGIQAGVRTMFNAYANELMEELWPQS